MGLVESWRKVSALLTLMLVALLSPSTSLSSGEQGRFSTTRQLEVAQITGELASEQWLPEGLEKTQKDQFAGGDSADLPSLPLPAVSESRSQFPASRPATFSTQNSYRPYEARAPPAL